MNSNSVQVEENCSELNLILFISQLVWEKN